jgi:hypothetical protein
MVVARAVSEAIQQFQGITMRRLSADWDSDDTR